MRGADLRIHFRRSVLGVWWWENDENVVEVGFRGKYMIGRECDPGRIGVV